MPRENRTQSQDESSGSGLKIVAIILALACLGLGYGLYRRNSSAGERMEDDAKVFQSLSNQVDGFRTKLAMEQSNNSLAQSNQQHLVDRRTAELINASNRFVQTSLLLAQVQREVDAAHAELQAKAVAVAALESQRDEQGRKLETIPGLQSELSGAKEKVTQATRERDELAVSLGRIEVEKADLERKLDDPAFLRLQVKKAEESMELRRRMAAAGRIDSLDRKARLEMDQDGSVKAIMPQLTQSKK